MCFTDTNFAQLLDRYQYSFNVGDIIAGTIFSKEEKGYLVDIGADNAAYLPNNEIYLETYSNGVELSRSEIQEFFILAYNIKTKQLVLSLKRLEYLISWDRIKQLKSENIAIEVKIIGLNKGGGLVLLENIQGFIPNSHLAYMEKKEELLNQHIACKFLIVDEQCNQLVLSSRCAQLERIPNIVNLGAYVEAPVAEVKQYGIFFKIEKIPALLHISEIPEKYNSNISYYFPIGKIWKVKVIHIDRKQGRLSVSLLD
uniref:30S ribosomal protein S1 n=1 Tax=Palmaria palmata TaxID=2822 RepID=A0A455TMN7_PALPL|nr:30S ribosomal protein S1 [Palmaria palmata]